MSLIVVKPILEHNHLTLLISLPSILLAFWLLDKYLIQKYKINGRYFAIHAIANTCISILTIQDVYHLFIDPIQYIASPCNYPTLTISFVIAIHLYHTLFYKLSWIDKLHHIVMILVATPMLYVSGSGHTGSLCLLFMCGIPGGLDYLMLVLVKQGYIKPLIEKKYNCILHVWIRAFFLNLCFAYSYINLISQYNTIPWWQSSCRVGCLLSVFWNSQFFMERVVGNFHVCTFRDTQLSKEESKHVDMKDTKGILSAFETREHLANSLPGLKRVSLSHQDLLSLSRKYKY